MPHMKHLHVKYVRTLGQDDFHNGVENTTFFSHKFYINYEKLAQRNSIGENSKRIN